MKNSAQQTTINHALRLNLSIFPCNSGFNDPKKVKRPLTYDGFKSASREVTRVEEMFRYLKDALVGLPTGKTNDLLVLDIDETETISGEDTLVKAGISLTDSWQVRTPRGGRHIYFKYPDNIEKIPNKAGNLIGPGIDLRADGGYVIFPGSVSCIGRYEFLEGLCPETSEIQEAPDWLLEKISGRSNSNSFRTSEDLILEGSRNIILFKKASLLVDAGLDEFKILEELSRVNNTLCTPPLEPEEIRRIVSSANKKTSKKKYEMTDLGNASRFADINFENLRYCGVTKVWCEMNGHLINPLNRIPYEHIKTVLTEIQKDLVESTNPSALLSWYKKSQNVARLDACLKIASNDSKLLLDQSKIDCYNSYLAVQNGVVNLKKNELADQPPGQYMLQANVHFNSESECPNFVDFIQEICSGDKTMMSELQKAIGYTFSGDTRYQVMFVCLGDGANGKSTLLEVLRQILGSYSGRLPGKSLSQQNANRIPNDLAGLKGKRFAVVTEFPDKTKLNSTLLKELTGNDAIPARFLYKEFFEYRPNFKIWLATNHKVRFSEDDFAMRRRVVVFKFKQTFTGEKREENLIKKLKAEDSGILNWAIKGYNLALQQGFKTEGEIISTQSDENSLFKVFKEYYAKEVSIVPNDDVTTIALISTMFKQIMFPNEKEGFRFEEALIMRFMQRLGHRSSRMREGNTRYYGYRNIELRNKPPCPF